MSSGGGNNLGPRLLVILLGIGVVVLGMYPIKKQYGGVRGALKKSFPQGLEFNAPSVQEIRNYLVSLGREKDRRLEGLEEKESVRTVKLSSPPEEEKSIFSSSGFLSNLLRFGESSNIKNPGRETHKTAKDMQNSSDSTQGRSLKRPLAAQAQNVKTQEPRLDALSNKDREELNKLVDGF